MNEIEYRERLRSQMLHPLYQDTLDYYKHVQSEQTQKAARKYPTPLNPAEWGGEKLVRHAFEELVDQSHYLTAMLEVFREMQSRIEHLEAENKGLREGREDGF